MKQLITLMLFACTSALLSACSDPQGGTPPQSTAEGRRIQAGTSDVDELLDKSGLNHTLSQLPRTVLATTDTLLSKGVVEVNTIRDIFSATYNPGDLRQQVRNTLLEKLSTQQVADMIAWYDSPLGQKIRAIDTQVTGQDQHEIRSRYQQLANNAARLELVRELENYQNSAAYRTDEILVLQKSVQLAINQALPEDETLTEAELIAQEDSAREQIEKRQRRIVEATNLYNAQSLSDDELRNYIAFTQTETAKAYERAVSEAIQAAFDNAGKKAGLKIVAFYAG